MLRELHIKNLAIIDDASVEFGKGFNVLTGETGAGKSIIINALSLALGERAVGELIRSGEKEMLVEALFDPPPKLPNHSIYESLHDAGIEVEDGIIMRRLVSSHGRSRAYINGSMVNVQTLSDVSRSIIDVHGQYEHQSLLSQEIQLDMLDEYGGLLPDREEVKSVYEKLNNLKRRISELDIKEKERTQRLDMLKFQINEIDSADLKNGEEESLTEEAKVLGSAVRLTELANHSYDSLYSSESSCIANLSKILGSLKAISEIDSNADGSVKSLEEAIPLLEDAAYFLRDYKDSLNFSPERLDAVHERLEIIKGFKRKYGDSVKAILDFKDEAEKEFNELERSEEMSGSLKDELTGLKGAFTDKASALSKKRAQVAKKIEPLIEAELSKLSMPDTKFSINFSRETGDDTTDGLKAKQNGIDDIEFLLSPNIGEELKPLSKIASGGELSRIMLALKGILSKGDRIPVLVFDEIDAGIGGIAAEAVGQRLKNLSSSHQVICITHLPQIASYADRHLKIEKKVQGKRTVVEIREIEKEERTEEIARMLSGEASGASMKHAREMLKAKSKKQ
ncbi:MAG: DNA repair protein RecN [Nitrospirota bacterium]